MVVIKCNQSYLGQLVELFEEYRSFYDFTPSPKETEEFLLGLMDRNDSVIFIAVDERSDKVMGFVNLYPCYSTLALKRLWILNDIGVTGKFRGQGVSKALIDKVMTFAKETNAVRVELKTDKANDRAMKLYDSIGFKIDNDNVYYRVPV